MNKEREPELQIKIRVEEDGVLIVKADTYSFEMAEMHLGSLERFYKNYKEKEAEQRLAEEIEAEEEAREEKEKLNQI